MKLSVTRLFFYPFEVSLVLLRHYNTDIKNIERHMLDQHQLVKLATVKMPFGKYEGRVLMDLPEEYLLWFAKKGFPSSELGSLMALALEIKVEGLDALLMPIKKALRTR